MVGVHIPYDGCSHRNDQVLERGDQCRHTGARRRPLRDFHAHRHRPAGVHDPARVRPPRPLPQRHCHRHQRQEAQAQQPRRPPSPEVVPPQDRELGGQGHRALLEVRQLRLQGRRGWFRRQPRIGW
ncbi:unnamed protein product [Linum tenue]|uniref:Uncharacterized protein n=1 Tax=Linum tenue TaxID=586396 RepID=A0AAV0MSP1_9ROSI|nr:unnamed protein product [Linum tenue]